MELVTDVSKIGVRTRMHTHDSQKYLVCLDIILGRHSSDHTVEKYGKLKHGLKGLVFIKTNRILRSS